MVEAHEMHERVHEAGHSNNKGVAILIAVLAAMLAITEMGAKNAATHYTSKQIEAANLWSFYQAKTIRLTTVRVPAEAFQALGPESFGDRAAAITQQMRRWRETGDRYESEPSTGEGRQELSARARATEDERDKALSRLHLFEIASAGFQIAIVLASASVITGALLLVIGAGGLGLTAFVLSMLGWFAPNLVHL